MTTSSITNSNLEIFIELKPSNRQQRFQRGGHAPAGPGSADHIPAVLQALFGIFTVVPGKPPATKGLARLRGKFGARRSRRVSGFLLVEK